MYYIIRQSYGLVLHSIPVVREFCRISMEFIKKGVNVRMYTAAAREFPFLFLFFGNGIIPFYLKKNLEWMSTLCVMELKG